MNFKCLTVINPKTFLQGPQEKLGLALTKVYEKANSVCTAEIKAPSWIHRHIIGKKGTGIRAITQDYPKVRSENISLMPGRHGSFY